MELTKGTFILPQKPQQNHRTLVLIVIGIVILAIILIAAYAVLKFTSTKTTAFLPANTEFLVSYSPYELGYLSLLTNGTTTPSRIHIPTAAGVILDEARDTSNTYYILPGTDNKSTEIYVASRSGNQQLFVLTTSSYIRSHLSYDATSSTLVYQIGKIQTINDIPGKTDWQVASLNTKTLTENILGAGSDPVITSAGAILAVQNGGIYDLNSPYATSSQEVVALATSSPYAVSDDGKTLAIYNPITSSIDYLDSSELPYVSFKYAKQVPFAPTAMTFVHNTLLIGAVLPENGKLTYTLLYPDTGEKMNLIPANPLSEIYLGMLKPLYE